MTFLNPLIACAGAIMMTSLPLAAQEAKPIALGTVTTAIFMGKACKDAWVFDAEEGVAYDITVVDGYN